MKKRVLVLRPYIKFRFECGYNVVLRVLKGASSQSLYYIRKCEEDKK